MNIKINIEKQKLYLKKEPYEGPYIVSDSINYLQCIFKFSDDWTDFDKTATFKDDSGNAYSILLENDQCTVPYEVLSGNKFKVSVFGSKDGVRITTNEVVVPIVPSGYVEGKTPSKPPKTAYELILDKLRQIGTLLRLQTNNKETLVEAINEVKGDVASKADQTALNAMIKDDELLKYYGTTNIQPSGSELFTFTGLEDGTYAVAPKDKKTISGDIVIPYEYNNKLVTAINNADEYRAFYECKGITSIVLPNSITLIGKEAFNGCSFSEITIPRSVKKILNYAFYSCVKLNKVILKEGIEEINYRAFYGCNNLLYIEIPKGTISIGEEAFEGTTTQPNYDAGIKKQIYYAGTKTEFDTLKNTGGLVWNSDIHCNYTDETTIKNAQTDIINQRNAISENKKDIKSLSTDLSELKTAFLKGMQIKEFILCSGDTFVLKPNTIFVAFPPDKTMEIYKVDGTRVASEAGIIGAVCSELKYDKDVSKYQFRSCTLYQQKGLIGTDYEASYFYFEEGAYIKYTGSSGYARVLCNVPVTVDN